MTYHAYFFSYLHGGDQDITRSISVEIFCEQPSNRLDMRVDYIRFLAIIPQSGELVEIYVNIEVQNNDIPGYPIPMRGIYHVARPISARRGTVFKEQEYGKIKRVVGIWICEDTAEKRSDTINRYSFTEECKRGNFHEEKQNYDLMTVVVLRFGVIQKKVVAMCKSKR